MQAGLLRFAWSQICQMLEFNLQPFPALETERLHLRRIDVGDLADIFRLRSDINVMLYIRRPLARHADDAMTFINMVEEGLKNNTGITWAIVPKTGKKYIGSIGLWRIYKENYRAEIGYMLDPLWQRKGLMIEAVKAVVEFGFTEMKLHSIEAMVDPSNKPSAQLLEKSGFLREAYFRENIHFEGRFWDTFIYSLLNSSQSQ
jgi:ribosomal-protein-alanine N-acetyltransferase